MNANEIESAIEHAINALSLAKLALSKSALPVFNPSDVLRKVEPLAEHWSPGDPGAAALAALADLQGRVGELKAADAARVRDDMARKACRVEDAR